jgi:hypothetical protein
VAEEPYQQADTGQKAEALDPGGAGGRTGAQDSESFDTAARAATSTGSHTGENGGA